MKMAFVIAFLVASSTQAQAASCGEHEATLRNVKLVEWPGYYRSGDSNGLSEFLMDAFQVVNGDGSVSTKADKVSWVAKESWSAEDFVYTITSITCIGSSTAVIVGEGRFVAGVNDARRKHRYVSSNTLHLHNGRWSPFSIAYLG